MLEEIELPPEGAVLDIELPRKGPKIVQPAPPVPKIRVVRQRYAIGAARALDDPRVKDGHLRLLWAIGVHVEEEGVAWPSITRLAAVARRSPSWVKAKLHDLHAWAYLRKLPWSDYPRLARKCGARADLRPVLRQALWEPDSPLPPRKEEAPIDPTLRTGRPWCFPHAIETTEKGDTMSMSFAERQLLTQNQIGAARAASTRLDQALQTAGENIDRRLGDLKAGILHFPPSPRANIQTAVKWIKMAANYPRAGSDDVLDAERMRALERWMKVELPGVTAAIIAHAEVQYRSMVGRPPQDSLTLAQLKPPSWAVRRGTE